MSTTHTLPRTSPTSHTDPITTIDMLDARVNAFRDALATHITDLDIYAQKILLYMGDLELRAVTQSIKHGTLLDASEQLTDLKTAYDLYNRTISTLRNIAILFGELDVALLKRNHHKERRTLLLTMERRVNECLTDLPFIVEFDDAPPGAAL